jgi:hypothetical protein
MILYVYRSVFDKSTVITQENSNLNIIQKTRIDLQYDFLVGILSFGWKNNLLEKMPLKITKTI